MTAKTVAKMVLDIVLITDSIVVWKTLLLIAEGMTEGMTPILELLTTRQGLTSRQ